MRRSIIMLTALLGALTGCGGEDAPGTTAAAPTASTAPALTAAETDFLLALRADDGLMREYPGGELITLGHAICASHREGADPFAAAEAPGDGTFVFEEASEPVLAMDAIQVDLEARRYLCPDAR